MNVQGLRQSPSDDQIVLAVDGIYQEALKVASSGKAFSVFKRYFPGTSLPFRLLVLLLLSLL